MKLFFQYSKCLPYILFYQSFTVPEKVHSISKFVIIIIHRKYEMQSREYRKCVQIQTDQLKYYKDSIR